MASAGNLRPGTRQLTCWTDSACLGQTPTTVDLTELHRIMAAERIKLGAAAAHLGTDLHTIRYLLENHPAPRPDSSSGTQPANHITAYRTAKATLPRDRLADLYHRQRMSLRDIADTIGVSRQVIARLARDYDIPLRDPDVKLARRSTVSGSMTSTSQAPHPP